MPRFVLLLHETPPAYPRPTHYDLMLEQGDVLWTWALDDLPSPDQTTFAERLHNHRTAYLDFEGEVSGDRGAVRRIDAGTFEVVSHSLQRLDLRLHGTLLQGLLTLSQEAADQRWCVTFSSD